jgi:hypothetical protein
MFRDNATVKSWSPKPLNLVIRLHGLMTRSGVKIHIKGTDAVLRGYLGQGVMAGESMVPHIPVHATAVDRSPLDLVPWIRSWSGKETILLELDGWFETGHDIEGWRQDEDGFERPILLSVLKIYIWAPPPLAAEVAIKKIKNLEQIIQVNLLWERLQDLTRYPTSAPSQ